MQIEIKWGGEFLEDSYQYETHTQTYDCWYGTVRECGCGWAFSEEILKERLALLVEAISNQIDNDFDERFFVQVGLLQGNG
jgi:hypothetical protein